MIGILVSRRSNEDQLDWCGLHQPVCGGATQSQRWTRANSSLSSWAQDINFPLPFNIGIPSFMAVKYWDSHPVATAVLGPRSSHWGIDYWLPSFSGLQVVIVSRAFSVSITVWAHHHNKSLGSYQFLPLENYVIYQPLSSNFFVSSKEDGIICHLFGLASFPWRYVSGLSHIYIWLISSYY